MKRLIVINFLDHFISAALVITLPLLLLERKIEISTIGIIFSVLPFVFLITRLFFAAFADQIGAKIFFITNAVSNALSAAIYFLAKSPPIFALGKVAEGIKNSSFWAVNRTEIFLLSEKGKEEKNAAFLSGVRALATAIGAAATGFGLAYFSFNFFLFVLFLISLFLFIPSFSLKDRGGKVSLNHTFSLLDLRKKSAHFWFISIAMLFNAIAISALLSFVMPIFMKDRLSLSYQKIGGFFTLFYLISALSTFLALKLKISFSKLFPIQTFLFLPTAFLIPFSGETLFLWFFAILAIGVGFSSVIFESLVTNATKGLPSTSTDIGILHIPMRFSEFATVLAYGFIIERFGYFPVSALSAISFLLFSVFSFLIIKANSLKKLNQDAKKD